MTKLWNIIVDMVTGFCMGLGIGILIAVPVVLFLLWFHNRGVPQ